jgi:hypothetical protein
MFCCLTFSVLKIVASYILLIFKVDLGRQVNLGFVSPSWQELQEK